MPIGTADLHIHTHFSDGTFSPEQVVAEARACDLAAISITDHDTLDGIAPAQAAAAGSGLEVIAGIELSCEIEKKDIHLLGYYVDCADDDLQKVLVKMRDVRVKRIEQMLVTLKEQGVERITLDDVLSLTRCDAVGRLHLATMLQQKGYVASIQEAFTRFIGEGCPAYVPKHKQTPHEAIELIRRVGGVAVLAHPMINNRDELIPGFVEAGLQGIEAYYPNASKTTVAFYRGLAEKYHLVATGGSDAHGDAKKSTCIGATRVGIEVVERLKELSRHS